MQTVAWLGVGHIHTPGFIKQLAARTDVKVATLWDHDAARATQRASEVGAQVADSVEAALAVEGLTALIIASETCRHRELVQAALKTGKPLFVEKPLGMNGPDARAMAKAIEMAQVTFQTGHFMRGNPKLRFIKQALDKGHFGTVTRVRGSNCHGGSLGGWFDTEWRWMADPEQAGCGAFGDLGVHALDILMWWLGPVTSATARIELGTERYLGCDEVGEGLLQFESGALGTLAAGWLDVANPVSFEVCGTEGHATMVRGDLYFQSKHVDGADGKQPWTALEPEWPHAFSLFFDVLEGKGACDQLISARECAQRNAVMDALYAGSRERRWVDVVYG
jgi:predicted dehydrogenase